MGSTQGTCYSLGGGEGGYGGSHGAPAIARSVGGDQE